MAKNIKSIKRFIPILSIIAGAIIIFNPAILAWILGGYLIIWGILELL